MDRLATARAAVLVVRLADVGAAAPADLGAERLAEIARPPLGAQIERDALAALRVVARLRHARAVVDVLLARAAVAPVFAIGEPERAPVLRAPEVERGTAGAALDRL